MKRITFYIYATLVCGLLAACNVDPIVREGGKFPTAPEFPSGVLYAEESFEREMQNYMIDSDRTFYLKYRLTSPAEADVTVTLALGDEADVESYNKAKGLSDIIPLAYAPGYTWTNLYRLLPATNYTLPSELTLTVPKGETTSSPLALAVKYDDTLVPVEVIEEWDESRKYIRCPWMLPFKVVDIEGPVVAANRTLGIGIRVCGLYEETEYHNPSDYQYVDCPLDTDFVCVMYLNTNKYQPLLADKYIRRKGRRGEWRTFGNIINLRVTTVGYDANSNRALFLFSPDMRYVMEHAEKYIRPMQRKGRKVCVSIEGAGTGLGFCNMNDAQIADFVGQVKAAIDFYDIDGVNLFDRNSNYGKAGMPSMNTTSYPKLIKALREALGAEKLITVSDYERPTEYFWDTEATGGIAVGEYIDYAWSGYMSQDEPIQLLDPYNTVEDPDSYSIIVSEHTHKPIAGLEKEHFGHFALPFYAQEDESKLEFSSVEEGIGLWYSNRFCPNNIIVFGDIMSNEQSKYEGAWMTPSVMYRWVDFASGSAYEQAGANPGFYGYMLKDW